MKKFLLFALAVLAVVFASCNPNKPEEKESYTIMFYAVGGGNLDDNILGNIFSMIEESGNENINLTFEMKLSKPLQNVDEPALKDFDGVRRWSMQVKENKEIMEQIHQNISVPNYPSCLKTEKVHDADYFMGSAEAVAEFVAWSAKENPADHYILILNDHGNGWNITIDGAVCAGDEQPIHKAPQAMLFDDNVNDKCLATTDLVTALKQSGVHVDMVYMDACLMALAENIYPLMGVVDYFMGSLEVVPGLGGAYKKFLQCLKSQPADLFAAMSHYCDYCVSAEWWEALNKDMDNNPRTSADIAIYDLNKMQPAFDAVRDFAKLTSEMLQNPETLSIKYDNGSEISYTHRELVEYATTRAQLAMTSNSNQVPFYFIVSTSILPLQFGDEGFMCSVSDFLIALNNPEFVNIITSDPELLQQQIEAILQYSNYGVCIADYMKQVSNEYAQFDDNRFAEIYNRYLSAIKDASHIAGTLAGQNMTAVYEDASMAANVYSLSEEGFHYFGDGEKFIFQGNRYAKDYSREQLIRYYKASEFDKFAAWSDILTNLNINPSFLTNRTRYENYAK